MQSRAVLESACSTSSVWPRCPPIGGATLPDSFCRGSDVGEVGEVDFADTVRRSAMSRLNGQSSASASLTASGSSLARRLLRLDELGLECLSSCCALVLNLSWSAQPAEVWY